MAEKKSEEKKAASKAIAVNVNKVLRKRNGDALRQPADYDKEFEFCEACAKKVIDAKGAEVTVRSVIVDALDSLPRQLPGQPPEKKLSGTEKLRRGNLAGKIYNAIEPLELSIDDLALIKKLVGEMQTPLVVSQVFPEIDPKTEEVE